MSCNLTFFNDCQEWKPRYGYKRGNDQTKDWLIEVPQNAGLHYCSVLIPTGAFGHDGKIETFHCPVQKSY